MLIKIAASKDRLKFATWRLLNSMFSPMCGLDQRITFILPGRRDPQFITSGCHPTGMYLLQDPDAKTAPNPLDYHIGGSGYLLDEALIRALGETAERYTQIISEAAGTCEIKFCNIAELPLYEADSRDPAWLQFLEPAQLEHESCLFEPYKKSSPLGWVQANSLTGERDCWLPAQLVLVGYRVRIKSGEPRIWSAVTTGTAVHSDHMSAVKGALLELIQIDSAMGHWYTRSTAPRIKESDRNKTIISLAHKLLRGTASQARFHWLANADLPGFHVACVITGERRNRLACVGLGAAMTLSEAMYKSLLEGIAVIQLAKVITLYEDGSEGAVSTGEHLSDLNRNVLLYATNEDAASQVELLFPEDECIDNDDLPCDFKGTDKEAVQEIILGFKKAGMDLYHLNLTTPDIGGLGLVSHRVWSPHVLGLCLPS